MGGFSNESKRLEGLPSFLCSQNETKSAPILNTSLIQILPCIEACVSIFIMETLDLGQLIVLPCLCPVLLLRLH